jgi:hypothetical protein
MQAFFLILSHAVVLDEVHRMANPILIGTTNFYRKFTETNSIFTKQDIIIIIIIIAIIIIIIIKTMI